ncbi:hypothetical protein RHMOL_Rhmol01G0296900 [Rhododendron molle]|uniref:Uncharacterized protein n=1 Tax=Rhododendron molle TaxID=49168 RepID=A0ACC0Q8E5_RHOML|nr:hypothetical protein RHMOL_Rhmol01G0296900 [Rhododendron molle]
MAPHGSYLEKKPQVPAASRILSTTSACRFVAIFCAIEADHRDLGVGSDISQQVYKELQRLDEEGGDGFDVALIRALQPVWFG